MTPSRAAAELPVDGAWQRLRAQSVAAFDAVAADRLYTIEDLDLCC